MMATRNHTPARVTLAATTARDMLSPVSVAESGFAKLTSRHGECAR